MPVPEKYLADFEEETSFHVYNCTNNNELLFYSDENRRYFLRNYEQRLSPFISTWCWCLLPNHFHLLVRVKSLAAVSQYLLSKDNRSLSLTEKKFLKGEIDLSELIEHTFKAFFQSYALAFNKQQGRKGNLFYKPFKRVKINNDEQFLQTVIYIHANALKHGIVTDFTLYKWSSWLSVLSSAATSLLRNELLDLFGGKEYFIKMHRDQGKYYYSAETAIEE